MNEQTIKQRNEEYKAKDKNNRINNEWQKQCSLDMSYKTLYYKVKSECMLPTK